MRTFLFSVGIIILIGAEILRVYFIMPFPGSQHDETISLAYFLHTNINLIRVIGLVLVAYPVVSFFRSGSRASRIIVSLSLVVYLVVFYFFNFRFLADKMFYQPGIKIFAKADASKIPSANLVIGVSVNGASKAYPIEIIGYHHQVRDTVGTTPVMVTNCTVCRTGRVFSPLVEGKAETFRLVGMDHFNAMFEDAATKSWWRQVTGEAIAGPMKGRKLQEIAAGQMRLDAWISLHPDTEIMQPDTTFNKQYEGMKNYEEGKSKGDLTRADSLSWKDKSWVVGVQHGMDARAYDWNELEAVKVIQDTLGGIPLLVTLAADSASFYVFKRDTLSFTFDPATYILRDTQTQSSWNIQGRCTEGKLQGTQLPVVQSYQEFWHSWRTFRPQTTAYHYAREGERELSNK